MAEIVASQAQSILSEVETPFLMRPNNPADAHATDHHQSIGVGTAAEMHSEPAHGESMHRSVADADFQSKLEKRQQSGKPACVVEHPQKFKI